MEKNGKILLIILIFIIGLILLDTLQARIFKRSPIISWQEKLEDNYSWVDRGLLLDTYYCVLEKDIITVSWKLKYTKYTCPVDRDNLSVVDIIDRTKDIEDFACAEALEEFFEDENFTYFYPCIKDKYMIVKYENGYEETISSALKNGRITLNDLDEYTTAYIKYAKEKIQEEDILADNGLLFSIAKRLNCISVRLNVYNEGKYELMTSYKACRSNEFCTQQLVYTQKETGTYNFDVIKIIQNSKFSDGMSFSNTNMPEYEIYTGNEQILITDSSNLYLNEFLKQTNINLNTCAEPDYN